MPPTVSGSVHNACDRGVHQVRIAVYSDDHGFGHRPLDSTLGHGLAADVDPDRDRPQDREPRTVPSALATRLTLGAAEVLALTAEGNVGASSATE